MPFGEMTITLDDVACMLHLLVRGRFFTPRSFTMEEAATLAAELLGDTYESALEETARNMGGYFTQQWLYHCYQRNVNIYQRFDCAARAYMLMLVGCTIFADDDRNFYCIFSISISSKMTKTGPNTKENLQKQEKASRQGPRCQNTRKSPKSEENEHFIVARWLPSCHDGSCLLAKKTEE
ncbi:hypothetical protein QL285_075218 [Trifolium repens]|nr:hypothetical protein QL285_075218 [Trifolium repens]